MPTMRPNENQFMQYNRNYFNIDNISLGPAMTCRLIVATVTNMSACACAIVTGCLSIVCTPSATLRRPHAVSGRTPIKKSSCKYYKLANNIRNMYDNIHWQVWVTWNDLVGYFGEKWHVWFQFSGSAITVLCIAYGPFRHGVFGQTMSRACVRCQK